MTTIFFDEDINIKKTNFKNIYDFNQYIYENLDDFEIPEMNFIEYDKLNNNDKKLFDSIENMDKNKFTNI